MRRLIGNLPAEVSSFVGRNREVSEVRRLLDSSRLVTLTGVGGVGKTRLALHTAASYQRVYEDGVWLVDLSKLSQPDSLADAVAGVLDIAEHSARSGLAALCDHLRERRLLLILDNCEHMRSSCAALVDQLLAVAPGLRILATSRQELRAAGEHVMDVPPLSLPDESQPPPPLNKLADYEAVALFVERADQRGSFALTPENQHAVLGICRRLDGIPLAIELATVRLRMLSPEQILERLDDRWRLLNTGSPTMATRHQTLHGLIDWSFELCSEAERMLWIRCAVFAGGFDLEAAERVCAGQGVEVEQMVDVIDGLVDKSILIVEGRGSTARYRLLETIRQYGQARLDATDERASLHRRHVDYYAWLAAKAARRMFGPNHIDWLARLRRDHANMRLALEYAREMANWRLALRLAADLRYHWVTCAFVHEGRRWLDQLLTLAPEYTAERADALWVNSWLAITQGDMSSANALVAEGHVVSETAQAAAARGYVALFAGQLAMYDGNRDSALEFYQKALRHHRAVGDLEGTVMTLNRLSLAHSALGHGREALSAAEDSRDLCESRGDLAHKSYALWVLGIEVWRQGDNDRALTLQRESLGIRLRMQDIQGLTLNIEVLSWIAATGESHERAARLLGICMILRNSIGTQLSGWGHLAEFHDQCEAKARAALGDQGYAEAVQFGSSLSFDEAIAYALGDLPRPRTEAAAPVESTMETPELTRREREVVELLADGQSNRDIASTLAISQRTAETHVANILSKLRFSSRSQIARWASCGAPGAELHDEQDTSARPARPQASSAS
jgi:predicted ATPase/DNA-binding CsgD family transcriptional regulator